MVNFNIKDSLFLLSGIIGSLILLLGLKAIPTQLCYLIGSILLLFTALHFRIIYFIALELILIAGHGADLLHIGKILQAAVPLMLTIQLLAFYFFSGQLNNPFVIAGITGIALHSIGFVYENQWIFLFGSIGITSYALYAVSKGKKAAWLWAILNILFALIDLKKLIFS